MSPLIGKRIECFLDTAHGDKTPFVCDVKPGRRESEVFLQPVGECPAGAKGYQPIGVLYVRRILDPEEAEAAAPANVTQLPPPIPPAGPAGPTVVEAEAMLAEIRRLQGALAEAHQQNDKLQAALDARPVVATPVPTPVVEGEAPPAGELALSPPPSDLTAPAAEAELTDDRRISESPISPSTRRRRGSGGPADHGSNAETADAYQEKK